MATYQDTAYSSKSYSDFRPTYKTPLFTSIVDYHKSNGGEFSTALDLGTGTGQAAIGLVDYFDKVIGVDVSPVMIQSATKHPKIEYVVGDCLQVPVPDKSIDLLVVGEALHWFPVPNFWDEVKRIVKPGGTFGFWGYTNNISYNYPIITDLIWEFTTVTTGPYWDKGREKMDELHQAYLKDLPFTNIQGRVFFPHPKIDYCDKIKQFCELNPNYATNSIPDTGFVTPMKNLEQLSKFLKTWSGYHNYLKNNPTAEDPVDNMIQRAIAATGLKLDQEFDLLFPQEVVLSKV
jgi:SAM-dependent methyltransferase